MPQNSRNRTASSALLPALVVALAILGLCSQASALTLTASATVALPLDGPGSPQSDFDSDSGPGATLAEASASDLVDYNAATPTVFEGSAFGQATPSSLRVSTDFSATNLVPEVMNEGAFVSASTRLLRTYTPSYDRAPSDLWLSPIFAIDGSLQADALVRSTVSFTMRATTVAVFSDQTLLDLVAPSDGTELPVLGELTRVAAMPFGVGPGINFTLDLRLSAETNMGLDPPAPAGDYSGFVDLGSTVSFIGISVFEDQAMTQPFLGNIEILDEGGGLVPILPIPEPGTGLLVALGVAWLASPTARALRDRARRCS